MRPTRLRPRPPFAAPAPALLLAAALAAPAPGHAFERQWHAGAGLGVGRFARGDRSGVGPVLDLGVSYGLSDQFNLLGEIALGSFGVSAPAPPPPAPGQPPPPPPAGPGNYAFQSAVVGVAYTLDVLRWVPYGGLFVGAARVAAGEGFGGALSGDAYRRVALDAGAAAGLDYQLTRAVAVGGVVRYHLAFTEPRASLLFGGLRVQYTWGF
ncbi:MAG TPA: outer membrane beta-barrel protein [Polyangiaceae bacterium]|nr:outer membrane beta-barrel protein [Polyangiaceae bacterium]